MLKAMGIEDEKIDQIIDEHAESVNALKAQRDEFKEAAGKADGYKKELDALKAKGEGAGEYEEKYKAAVKNLEDYKAKVEGEKPRPRSAACTESCSSRRASTPSASRPFSRSQTSRA